jgi:hypothetical protein
VDAVLSAGELVIDEEERALLENTGLEWKVEKKLLTENIMSKKWKK